MVSGDLGPVPAVGSLGTRLNRAPTPAPTSRKVAQRSVTTLTSSAVDPSGREGPGSVLEVRNHLPGLDDESLDPEPGTLVLPNQFIHHLLSPSWAIFSGTERGNLDR